MTGTRTHSRSAIEGNGALTTDLRRSATAGAVFTPLAPLPPLDYYLIFAEAGDNVPVPAVDGIVVEEFALADDYSAVGLNSARWTPSEGRWWTSAGLSRDMRGDPGLRKRVVAADRHDVEQVYRQLGGGELPDETTLRTYFQDFVPLATSTPLRLGLGPALDGYREKRVYRVLFANELGPAHVAHLQTLWRMAVADDAADPQARVVGTAQLPVGGDLFTWDLRRIGPGIAWCLDLTACLGGSSGKAIGPLLRELTMVMRRQGMIPVTIERFS